MTLLIRRAQPSDDATLLALDREVWAAGTAFPSVLERQRDSFFDSVDPETALVAVLDGDVVGYLTLVRPTPLPENAHVRQIEGFAVAPAAREQGVGARLLHDARDLARELGASKISLRVLSTNVSARRVYEEAGFRVEGVLSGEFCLDGELVDDVLMAQILR